VRQAAATPFVSESSNARKGIKTPVFWPAQFHFCV